MASNVSRGAKGMDDSDKLVEKWKKRALTAEGALQHITSRLEDVKRKVDQMKQLEFAARAAEQEKREAMAQVSHLKVVLAARESAIKQLTEQLEEEKQDREKETRHVAEKAEQIRQWVKHKVAELEEENQRLRGIARSSSRETDCSMQTPDFTDEEDVSQRHSPAPPLPPRRWAKPPAENLTQQLRLAKTGQMSPDTKQEEKPERPPCPDLSDLSPSYWRKSGASFAWDRSRANSEPDLLSASGDIEEEMEMKSNSMHQSTPDILQLVDSEKSNTYLVPKDVFPHHRRLAGVVSSDTSFVSPRKVSAPPHIDTVSPPRRPCRRRAVTTAEDSVNDREILHSLVASRDQSCGEDEEAGDNVFPLQPRLDIHGKVVQSPHDRFGKNAPRARCLSDHAGLNPYFSSVFTYEPIGSFLARGEENVLLPRQPFSSVHSPVVKVGKMVGVDNSSAEGGQQRTDWQDNLDVGEDAESFYSVSPLSKDSGSDEEHEDVKKAQLHPNAQQQLHEVASAFSPAVVHTPLENAHHAPVFSTVREGGGVRALRAVTFSADWSDSESEIVQSSDDLDSKEDSDESPRSNLSASAPAGSLLDEEVPMVAARSAVTGGKRPLQKAVRDMCFHRSQSIFVRPVDSSGKLRPRVLSSGRIDMPSLSENELRHSSYLTRQTGKNKPFKRAWYVLKDNKLAYYRSQEDEGKRKPVGQLSLRHLCAVSRAESANTLQITTISASYLLTADSSAELEAWLEVLRNVLRDSIHEPLVDQVQTQRGDYSGWVVRVQSGRAKRCWAVINGSHLLFSAKQSQIPFAELDLQDCTICEVDSKGVEHSEAALNVAVELLRKHLHAPEHFTVTLVTSDGEMTSLTISGKEHKDMWMFHLISASKGFDETDTERVISMLMDKEHQLLADFEGDTTMWWKHPVLTYTNKDINQPLTTLPTKALQKKAVALFKNIQLFCKVELEQRGINYHVAHVQMLLQTIWENPELHNEIYCQLIRQMRHHPQPTSHEVLQSWRLLALCIPLFLPMHKFLWYLQQHIHRHLDYRGEIATVAAFSQRCLQRAQQNGCRLGLPSRLEIQCVLLGELSKSLPVVLPVNLLDGSVVAMECDSSTLVRELTAALNERLGLRDNLWSGFALFINQADRNEEEEDCLHPNGKVCDAVWQVEHKAVQSQPPGRLPQHFLWHITYKNRLYFKSLTSKETEMEKRLFMHQMHQEVVNSRFPTKEEFALDLLAHVVQVVEGPCPAGADAHRREAALQQALARFYPKKLLTGATMNDKLRLSRRLWVKWDCLSSKTPIECVAMYLRLVRRWPYCGAKLFACLGKPASTDQTCQPLWLAVQEDCLALLHRDTLVAIATYPYQAVVTFGGCHGDFMLVVEDQQELSLPHSSMETSGTQKLLFEMEEKMIVAATLHIASFINMAERQKDILDQVVANST